MRLALNAARELAEISDDDLSNDAMWYKVMASPPLRSVFETALGLPSAFGQLDLERQMEEFRSKLDSFSGDSEVSQFASEENREALVQRFLLMSQVSRTSSLSPGQVALTLLQS